MVREIAPLLTSESVARLVAQARPMWFPSREHFLERRAALVAFTSGVLGQSGKTRSWLRCALGSLEAYLSREEAWDRLLRGDLATQVSCLNDWVADLRDRGLSHTTVHTYWRAVSSALNRMADQDGTVSPARFAARPEPGLRRPRALPRDAVERLFRFVRNQQWSSPLERTRNVALLGVMALAGLRRGEVLRLEVGDVELSERTLRIQRGKGRGGGRDRTAYMTPQLASLLSAYLGERRRAGRTHPEVFTSTVGNRGIGEVTIRRLFHQIRIGTGIHVTPHMLRHSYATMVRQAGVSDRVAMELLGHRSLAVLQRYSAVFDGECAADAGRLRLDIPVD
jgi:integrase